MKMGTTASPWRYDAAARRAPKLASLRCSVIEHYASWIHPIEEWAGYRSKAAIPGSITDKREELEAVVCRAPWVRMVMASLPPHITSRALGADDLFSGGIIEI